MRVCVCVCVCFKAEVNRGRKCWTPKFPQVDLHIYTYIYIYINNIYTHIYIYKYMYIYVGFTAAFSFIAHVRIHYLHPT